MAYRLTRVILLILSCVLIQDSVSGQKLLYEQYTSKNGLNSSIVYRITKDEKGFLWLSTDYGVSRFDSHRFNNNFLNNFYGTIIGLASDAKNNIWSGGLHNNLYKINSDTTIRISIPDKKIDNNILHVCIDSIQRKWFVYDDGIIGYVKNETIIQLKPKDNKGNFIKINNLLVLRDGTILALANTGVYKYLQSENFSPYTEALVDKQIFCGVEKPSGIILFGGNGVIYEYNGLDVQLSIVGNNPIVAIRKFQKNTYWIIFSGEPGLYLYEKDALVNHSDKIGLGTVFINDILTDENGVVFIATHGKGLYVINNFNIISYNPGTTLQSSNTYSIAEDENKNIYAGGYGGIIMYNNELTKPFNQINFAKDEMVNDMLWSKGQFWVVTPFYIYKYDTEKNKLYKKQFGAISLAEDTSGNIIVGGYMHLLKYDPKTDLSETPILCTLSPKGERISELFVTNKNIIWASANDQVFRITNNKTSVFDSSNSPITGYVSDMLIDSADNIWIATSNGLLTYTKGKTWKKYTTKNGLTNKNCTSISFAGKQLYVGTSKGLNVWNGTSFQKYTANAALLSEDINIIFKDNSENLWIGTNDGLYQWLYDKDKESEKIAPVNILGIKIDTSEISYLLTDTVTIGYKNNFLSVEYISINFKRSSDIIYEYRFRNRESSWHKTTNRAITFSSLNPGSYTLEIRAGYFNASTKSTSTLLKIFVKKPYWQKWWFITLSAALFVVTILLIIKWYTNKEKSKAIEKSRRDIRELKLKQQAVNALVNPHFLFNSLNSIQSFINHSDTTLANRFLSRFAKLIRFTMENATHLQVPLKDELALLEHYLSLEEIRLDGKLSYKIECQKNIDSLCVFVPSMLLQPYIENAVWHGITPKTTPGHIYISISQSDTRYLTVKIQDNGIGLAESSKKKSLHQHKSRGISITKERLEIIEKLTGYPLKCEVIPLYMSNGTSKGTLVIINIPVQYNINQNKSAEY